MKKIAILYLFFVTLSATQLKVPSQYSTIQLAIDAASAGDTVFVAAGNYTENITFKGKNIVELGAGLGRDTIFFAINSIQVEALDYSQKAIEIINNKSKKLNLTQLIKTKNFDVRKKLPFDNGSIDGCFSHMLYCMALSNYDLENLNKEILRILKPGGINIYTVRTTEDGDYKNGTHIGEDLY